MSRPGYHCGIELTLQYLKSLGTILRDHRDLVVTVEIFGCQQKSRYLSSSFPAYIGQTFYFDRVFWSPVTPIEVIDMLDDFPVKIEVRQLSDSAVSPGKLLAYYNNTAKDFLFPFNDTTGINLEKEVYMEKTYEFDGTTPKLEFSSRTRLDEVCPPCVPSPCFYRSCTPTFLRRSPSPNFGKYGGASSGSFFNKSQTSASAGKGLQETPKKAFTNGSDFNNTGDSGIKLNESFNTTGGASKGAVEERSGGVRERRGRSASPVKKSDAFALNKSSYNNNNNNAVSKYERQESSGERDNKLDKTPYRPNPYYYDSWYWHNRYHQRYNHWGGCDPYFYHHYDDCHHHTPYHHHHHHGPYYDYYGLRYPYLNDSQMYHPSYTPERSYLY